MRIISWNIFLKKDNTADVARFIEQEKIDIICLQEATRSFSKKTDKMYHSATDLNEHFEKSHPYNFFAPSFIADLKAA
ncbi:MAG: hypothetical protein LBL47_04710 [Lactobacillus sp.]|jgi:exonuclease III|nr:hypothetical protein [Lactobacillus sp.]